MHTHAQRERERQRGRRLAENFLKLMTGQQTTDPRNSENNNQDKSPKEKKLSDTCMSSNFFFSSLPFYSFSVFGAKQNF